MRHIHTSIVSMHLATRGNNKILHPPHSISSEKIVPSLIIAPVPNSEQKNHISSNLTYTKSTPKQIHHLYSPFVTTTYTPSLQLHQHTPHIVAHGLVDRPRRCDCTAGQMDGEAGWWTTSERIELPPTSKG